MNVLIVGVLELQKANINKVKEYKKMLNKLTLGEDNWGIYYLYVYFGGYGGFGCIPKEIADILIEKYKWKVAKDANKYGPTAKLAKLDSGENYWLISRTHDDIEDFAIRTDPEFIKAIIEAQYLNKDLTLRQRWGNYTFKYQIAKIYLKNLAPELDNYDGCETIQQDYGEIRLEDEKSHLIIKELLGLDVTLLNKGKIK